MAFAGMGEFDISMDEIKLRGTVKKKKKKKVPGEAGARTEHVMFPHLKKIGFAGPVVRVEEAPPPPGQVIVDTDALLKASRKARLPKPKFRQDDPSRPRRTAVERSAQQSLQLYWGASEGNVRKIRNALNNGARVNTTDSFFNTALHLAAGGGHRAAVKLLLEFGAIRTAVNKFGHTPADRAAINGHSVVVKILQTSGYSHIHKQREFVRNLLRSGALPTADEIIRYSGGSTDAGTEEEAMKARLAGGPPIPPMMERLLKKIGFKEDVDRRRFVRGMMKDVPMARPGDPSLNDVMKRFGADKDEYEAVRREARKKGKEFKIGEYDPDDDEEEEVEEA